MTSRRLYHFPTIHSQAEMGGLGQSVMEVTLRRLGAQGWQRKTGLIAHFWSSIESIIWQELALPYDRTRVYQDGLPVCGKEQEIVEELARMGSPNHRLLLRLRERGAEIMGTEAGELLVEEYNRAKELLDAADARETLQLEVAQRTAGDLLLKRRDAFIAARIGLTLLPGETGVLFLGILHDPLGNLPADIEVVCPLGTPSHQAARGGDER